jgi:hypothetical protein
LRAKQKVIKSFSDPDWIEGLLVHSASQVASG